MDYLHLYKFLESFESIRYSGILKTVEAHNTNGTNSSKVQWFCFQTMTGKLDKIVQISDNF
jgi:hypothetical protein